MSNSRSNILSPPIYRNLSVPLDNDAVPNLKSQINIKPKKAKRSCTLRGFTLFLSILEIVGSAVTGLGLGYLADSYPKFWAAFDPEKNLSNEFVHGIFVGFIILLWIEFVFGVWLLWGVTQDKPSQIRHWMTATITYELVQISLFIGLGIMEGFASVNVKLFAFWKVVFRVLELLVILVYVAEEEARFGGRPLYNGMKEGQDNISVATSFSNISITDIVPPPANPTTSDRDDEEYATADEEDGKFVEIRVILD